MIDAGAKPDASSDAGTETSPGQPPTTAAQDGGAGAPPENPPTATPDAGTRSETGPDAGVTYLPPPPALDAGTPAGPDAGSGPPPQFVQLTPDQLAPGEVPYCLEGEGRYARYVFEAYRTDVSGIDTCWVAWIGDTGGSLVFNIGSAWDEAKIYVKVGSDVAAPAWKPLGDGLGPVGPYATQDSFSLIVDPGANVPMVAWVMDESVHWDGTDLFVSRWDGQSWQPTTADGAARLNAAPINGPFEANTRAAHPRLYLDPAQDIVLTWTETDDTTGTTKTYHRIWNDEISGWTAPLAGP